MERNEALAWADINKYKDTLEKEPGSYCFAPLADLYRKLGLLDDAIKVAQAGCELHPHYVGGFMALGRAYLEKGQQTEAKISLEKVTAMTPDNLLAQRLLSQIYGDGGGEAAATPLSSSPHPTLDDPESPASLQTIAFGGSAGEGGPAEGDDATLDNEILFPSSSSDNFFAISENDITEDTDIIEELGDEDLVEEDPVQDDEFIISPAKMDVSFDEGVDLEKRTDPMATVTMAELYVSQGFTKRAFTIYRQLVDADPGNTNLKKRLYELKIAIDEDTATARYSQMAAGEGTIERSMAPDTGTLTHQESMAAGSGETVLQTLEKWLDGIQRRR